MKYCKITSFGFEGVKMQNRSCGSARRFLRVAASFNPRIRVIDGASFYARVTGREDALAQLFDALPRVLADCYPDSRHQLASLGKAGDYFRKAYGA
jgi:hypothetical protein